MADTSAVVMKEEAAAEEKAVAAEDAVVMAAAEDAVETVTKDTDKISKDASQQQSGLAPKQIKTGNNVTAETNQI